MIPQFLLCILFKENEDTNLKRYIIPMVVAVLFKIVKIQKQSKCPLVDGKRTYTHTHNGILLNHKKVWTLVISDNMDGL